MQRLKEIAKKRLKKDGFFYKILGPCYRFLSTLKYKLTHYQQEKRKEVALKKGIQKAIEKIQSYYKKEYIVFYNPTWLGVANSTKSLFENIVPLEQVYQKRKQKQIAKTIVDSQIQTVIFSQIVEGWIDIIRQIRKKSSNIKIKVIWHGNCYEFFSDYTWNLNKDVIKLCQDNQVNCVGFVRTTMSEFYHKVGVNVCYLQNNVHIKESLKKLKQDINRNNSDKKVKIGIYNADTRELKNLYTALSAIRLVPNAIADVVPINEGAKQFATLLGLESTSLDHYISTDELLQRIQQNEINIYPTYTENAPMFPLESFEMGVPCLLGNNNDYFVGTQLGEYVILEKEDDPAYIRDRIMYCLKNKEKIMNLYQQWKKEFDEKCDKWVKEFIRK